MVRVAPINLAYNPRTLWFNPGNIDVRKGNPVVVETARGTEYGVAADDIIEVSNSEIKSLKSPLRHVIRLATEEDAERAAEMEAKSREALPVFKQMAVDMEVEMHPVSVEFLLNGDKAIFYFEAEERVDFRELVRKLAAPFHVRVDMRQIGVRDEARIVGGLGHCGQELCCKRMGGEFNPVSIRMAKEQDLSLNPQKISGLCGRLMCCLRYEYEAYKDFKCRAPKQNATVQTPAGPAKVVELDVPREVVSLKVEGEKPVKVPLADFDAPEAGARPSVVGEEAWEAANDAASPGYNVDPVTFLTSQFTGADKLAEAGSVRHTRAGKARKSDAGKPGSGSSKKRARRGRVGAGAVAAPVEEARKPRRRRSTKIAAGSASEYAEADDRERRSSARKDQPSRNAAKSDRKARRSRVRLDDEVFAGEGGSASSARERKQGAGAGAGSKDARGAKAARSGAGRSADAGRSAGAGRSASAGKGVRPGQKSSGLSRAGDSPRHEGYPASAEGSGAHEAEASASAHRRSRKRSHKASGASGAPGSSSGAGATGTGRKEQSR